MIPPLDKRGLLPAGVHTAADWAELAACFAFNGHRQQLLACMLNWIGCELQYVAAGLDLVIGGSYLTNKPIPGDMDCTVIIPADEIALRGPAMQLLMVEGGKGRIWLEYKVEVYPTLRAPGVNDFSTYFQYVGEKSALLHQCAATDHRGIVKVLTWLPG